MDPICFLCNPDPRLIIGRDTHTFTMVGLGPLTNIYCILAANQHIRSFADFGISQPEAARELNHVRSDLELCVGPLLLTEHGRVPVCREDGDEHEQHCFHAHALLFATQADILGDAKTYYVEAANFRDFSVALAHAATQEHYLLISPAQDEYVVLSKPLHAPRQLARTLVALAIDRPDLADWRANPRREEALEMALNLRKALQKC